MELNRYIEHTNLKPDATKAEITTLLEEAKRYNFVGVCVNPSYVQFAKEYLKDSDIKVVTVIGFPLGQTTTEAKMLETIDVVEKEVHEIDMVINVAKLKDNDDEYILNEIQKVKFVSKGRPLKVIIETDLLTKEEIVKACKLCIQSGADYVKTSTGFVKNGVGAKAEDVKLMYDTVKDAGLKVKASGGIRDKETALKMIEAGASRIGTSSGVKICGG